MNKKQQKLALELADFLEYLAPELLFQETYESVVACGTAHCALGWATCLKSWCRAGWGWDEYRSYPMFRGFYALEAAERILGISSIECDLIFGPKASTPKQKSKQIRDLVAKYSKGE